jgi:hypothetical protein
MRGRDRIAWKDGVEYFLDVDEDTGSEVHPDSAIAFFVNGKCEQVAFTDVQRGTYFPAGMDRMSSLQIGCVLYR